MEGVDEAFASTFGNYVLHGMNEVVLPNAISWLPQTLGWQVLLLAVMAFIVMRLASALLSWYYNRYRSAALVALDSLFASPKRAVAAKQLPELLKATALQAYPRETVASLTGEEWLAFLNITAPTPCFDEVNGKLLMRLSYHNVDCVGLSDAELDSLYAAAKHWVQMHEVNVPSMSSVLRGMLFRKSDV